MKKKNDLTWGISLIMIGAATVILASSNIIGIELPDIAVRITGIIDLIALPVLAYTSVKKNKEGSKLKIKINKKERQKFYPLPSIIYLLPERIGKNVFI